MEFRSISTASKFEIYPVVDKGCCQYNEMKSDFDVDNPKAKIEAFQVEIPNQLGKTRRSAIYNESSSSFLKKKKYEWFDLICIANSSFKVNNPVTEMRFVEKETKNLPNNLLW